MIIDLVFARLKDQAEIVGPGRTFYLLHCPVTQCAIWKGPRVGPNTLVVRSATILLEAILER